MNAVTSDIGELQRTRNAWDRFMATGDVDHSVIRPVIAESWKRSKAYGVDPYSTSCFTRLRQNGLSKRLEQCRELVETAWPFMVMLQELVRGSGFRVDLTDSEGYLLKVTGDKEVLEQAAVLEFLPGACRAESQVGTCGIAVALVTGSPIQVAGPEHYNINIHRWTCSAAPIRHATGDIAGVLNMTGPCERVHKHTLGMVVAAAQAIEKEFSLRKSAQELAVANEFLETVTGSMSEGLIAVDNSGIVRHFNSAASRILKVDAREVVGWRASEAFSLWPALLALLDAALDRDVRDEEAMVRTRHGTVRCLVTVRVIRNEAGQSLGNLMIVNRMDRVRRLVHRMVGAQARFVFSDIVGKDPGLRCAIELARAAAQTSSKVLLQGETGTGKELFAQSIHNEGARREGPFLAINCAAVPRELIESELFGYDEGAFTGARRGGKPGKFELAEGGTLFLDEIESMPPEMQAKILRVIENAQLIRVGGSEVIDTNVRVITASNVDLAAEVAKGEFRADLFYRLNTVTINIPPLRDRRGDIPLLAAHFLIELSGTQPYRIADISDEALELLSSYQYPGNVRELQNIIERAVIIAGAKGLKTITADCLPDRVRLARRAATGPAGIKSLCEVEREAIQNALTETMGNVSAAARALGIGRNTLYRKIREHHITA